MTDILEAREKRRNQALDALRKIIKTLVEKRLMGPGKIIVANDSPNLLSYHLEIPINPEDFIIWQEILHDGS